MIISQLQIQLSSHRDAFARQHVQVPIGNIYMYIYASMQQLQQESRHQYSQANSLVRVAQVQYVC